MWIFFKASQRQTAKSKLSAYWLSVRSAQTGSYHLSYKCRTLSILFVAYGAICLLWFYSTFVRLRFLLSWDCWFPFLRKYPLSWCLTGTWYVKSLVCSDGSDFGLTSFCLETTFLHSLSDSSFPDSWRISLLAICKNLFTMY